MPATPQDRKPKADDRSHTFTVKGKKYKLPAITEKAVEKVPGGVMMDAILEPEGLQENIRLSMALLAAVEPSKEALAALRSLPASQMMEIVGEWMGKYEGSLVS